MIKTAEKSFEKCVSFVAQMSMLQINLLSWNCHEIRQILILQLDDKGASRYLIGLLCNNKLIGRLAVDRLNELF